MVSAPVYIPDDPHPNDQTNNQLIDSSNNQSIDQGYDRHVYSSTPTLSSAPFDPSLIDWSHWKNVWTYLEYYQTIDQTINYPINQSIHPAFSAYGPPPSEASQSLTSINQTVNQVINLVGSICCWLIAAVHLQQPHPFAQSNNQSNNHSSSDDSAFNFNQSINQYMLWSGPASCSASDSTFRYFFHSITDLFTTPVPATSNQVINQTFDCLNNLIASLFSVHQSISQSHLISLSIIFALITLVVSAMLWSAVSISLSNNQEAASSSDCPVSRNPLLVKTISCSNRSDL